MRKRLTALKGASVTRTGQVNRRRHAGNKTDNVNATVLLMLLAVLFVELQYYQPRQNRSLTQSQPQKTPPKTQATTTKFKQHASLMLNGFSHATGSVHMGSGATSNRDGITKAKWRHRFLRFQHAGVYTVALYVIPSRPLKRGQRIIVALDGGVYLFQHEMNSENEMNSVGMPVVWKGFRIEQNTTAALYYIPTSLEDTITIQTVMYMRVHRLND